MAVFYEIYCGRLKAYVAENVGKSVKSKGRLALPKTQLQLVASHLLKKIRYFNGRG